MATSKPDWTFPMAARPRTLHQITVNFLKNSQLTKKVEKLATHMYKRINTPVVQSIQSETLTIPKSSMAIDTPRSTQRCEPPSQQLHREDARPKACALSRKGGNPRRTKYASKVTGDWIKETTRKPYTPLAGALHKEKKRIWRWRLSAYFSERPVKHRNNRCGRILSISIVRQLPQQPSCLGRGISCFLLQFPCGLLERNERRTSPRGVSGMVMKRAFPNHSGTNDLVCHSRARHWLRVFFYFFETTRMHWTCLPQWKQANIKQNETEEATSQTQLKPEASIWKGSVQWPFTNTVDRLINGSLINTVTQSALWSVMPAWSDEFILWCCITCRGIRFILPFAAVSLH